MPDHRHGFIEFEIDHISGHVIEMSHAIKLAIETVEFPDIQHVEDKIDTQSMTASDVCDLKVIALNDQFMLDLGAATA